MVKVKVRHPRFWLFLAGFWDYALLAGVFIVVVGIALMILVGGVLAGLIDIYLAPQLVKAVGDDPAFNANNPDGSFWNFWFPWGFSAVTTTLQWYVFGFIRDVRISTWRPGQWVAAPIGLAIVAVDTWGDIGGMSVIAFNVTLEQNFLPPGEQRTIPWWIMAFLTVVVCAGYEPIMRIWLTRRIKQIISHKKNPTDPDPGD